MSTKADDPKLTSTNNAATLYTEKGEKSKPILPLKDMKESAEKNHKIFQAYFKTNKTLIAGGTSREFTNIFEGRAIGDFIFSDSFDHPKEFSQASQAFAVTHHIWINSASDPSKPKNVKIRVNALGFQIQEGNGPLKRFTNIDDLVKTLGLKENVTGKREYSWGSCFHWDDCG